MRIQEELRRLALTESEACGNALERAAAYIDEIEEYNRLLVSHNNRLLLEQQTKDMALHETLRAAQKAFDEKDAEIKELKGKIVQRVTEWAAGAKSVDESQVGYCIHVWALTNRSAIVKGKCELCGNSALETDCDHDLQHATHTMVVASYPDYQTATCRVCGAQFSTDVGDSTENRLEGCVPPPGTEQWAI